MPVSIGTYSGQVPLSDPDFSVVRYWYVSDKNGNFIQIDSQEKLDAIIAQMTPQEYEIWKNNYRFVPILNSTGNPWYSGTDEALK